VSVAYAGERTSGKTFLAVAERDDSQFFARTTPMPAAQLVRAVAAGEFRERTPSSCPTCFTSTTFVAGFSTMMERDEEGTYAQIDMQIRLSLIRRSMLGAHEEDRFLGESRGGYNTRTSKETCARSAHPNL
jgi:hypothetical protein